MERDGELRAVGASPTHHNLYPLKARLLQGEPLRVVAERVELRGHTLREKRSGCPAACGGGE